MEILGDVQKPRIIIESNSDGFLEYFYSIHTYGLQILGSHEQKRQSRISHVLKLVS